ncbi:MAG: hypothetical protein QOI01_5342 [Mycobacterium sp.]|jgi:hypothetical protein|nr:hypothetical protein [Mycobacterium sp.]
MFELPPVTSRPVTPTDAPADGNQSIIILGGIACPSA